jgi:D-alanyl-D-alanine carboxypeptidase
MQQRKYRRRKRRLHRLARRLFPAFIFLFSAIVCLTVFLPPGDKRGEASTGEKQAGTSTVGKPGANESGQDNPPQSGADSPTGSSVVPLTAPKPVAAGTWKLLLVNPWNPLPENYEVQTVTLQNGLQVDERCYPDLQAMMDACRADGLTPVLCSAYRTREVQEDLYQQEVGRYLDKGYDRDAAEAEAGKSVAVPGTSEHQLGLAVDVVDIDNQLLDESQEDTEVQKWLMAHSWEYGFILRYPTGKSEITGIIYEPWHYRYVGREDAKQIHDLGVCLEEYLAGSS